MLLAVLRNREGQALDVRGLGLVFAKLLVAAIAAAWAVAGTLPLLFGVPDAGPDPLTLGGKVWVLAQLVTGTLIGGATYALVTWLLGVRELRTILSILADLIRRRGRS